MKNITVSVQDDVYANARRQAAARNTSVSQLVADFLRALSREDELRAERAQRLNELFETADNRQQSGLISPFKRDEIYTEIRPSERE